MLKTVKYGETSIITTIYTELWGVQSYLVNGVRSSSKKGPGRANLFQPASMLDLVVYHNELGNLQRIKEFRWGYLYQGLFFEVVRNSVALYMVELLHKCLKQPEPNPDLFYFVEDAFTHLDTAEMDVVANFPLFFTLHLASFFGLRIQDDYSPDRSVLDLQEGFFTREQPAHQRALEDPFSYYTSQLLKVRQPHELNQLSLNRQTRQVLLHAYESFYAHHIQDFGSLRTLPVLEAVLG